MKYVVFHSLLLRNILYVCIYNCSFRKKRTSSALFLAEIDSGNEIIWENHTLY